MIQGFLIFFIFSTFGHINVTRIFAKFEGSTPSACRIMKIHVFFRHFSLHIFLKHFQKATIWLENKVRAWNCTGRCYTRYKRLLNKFQILAWLTKAEIHGSKSLQFLSWKFSLNFKRVFEDRKTRFFICMWFFHINEGFPTILYHKRTKIITHSWYI